MSDLVISECCLRDLTNLSRLPQLFVPSKRSIHRRDSLPDYSV